MACHVCGGEAVGRCFTCGRLFCDRHGSTDCVVCETAIVEGDPSPDRVTAHRPTRSSGIAWWRPQPADDYSPPACHVCGGLARAACRTCGRRYCPDHAGRASNCRPCSDAANVSLLVVAGIVAVLAVVFLLGMLMT